MSTTLRLDQFVDPNEATVIYTRDESGTVIDARFDLSGLPRLDPMLIGRPAADVPDIVKRLCGICPVTHHLAGTRALDALIDAPITPTARAVRALLHHGSLIDAAAPKLFSTNQELAIQLKRFGKAVMAAAGCPGHFPDVAIPGGVRAAANPDLVAALSIPELPEALAADAVVPDYDGYDLAVTSDNGELDPLGTHIAMHRSGHIELFPIQDWPRRVHETQPGAPAPRPVIGNDPYRVGPWAQQRIAASTSNPTVAMIQRSLDAVAELTHNPALIDGAVVAEGQLRAGVGVGVVDGPRGLLVHMYTVDDAGVLVDCQILTPTAQNEWWLAGMLREMVDVESSIRTADPCLPCSSAPPGQMNVTIKEERL